MVRLGLVENSERPRGRETTKNREQMVPAAPDYDPGPALPIACHHYLGPLFLSTLLFYLGSTFTTVSHHHPGWTSAPDLLLPTSLTNASECFLPPPCDPDHMLSSHWISTPGSHSPPSLTRGLGYLSKPVLPASCQHHFRPTVRNPLLNSQDHRYWLLLTSILDQLSRLFCTIIN